MRAGTRRAATGVAWVLAAAASGCASATYQASYTRELKRQFDEASLPVGFEKAKERLDELTPTLASRRPWNEARTITRCDPCLEELTCNDSHCLYRILEERPPTPTMPPSTGTPSNSESDYFLDLLRLDSEHTRLRLTHGPDDESLVRAFWTLLDPAGLSAAEKGAEQLATRETLIDEKDFAPSVTLTASTFFALGTAESGYGLRAGFRRWSTLHLIATFLFEYEHACVATSPCLLGPSSGFGTSLAPIWGHVLSAEPRIEIATWDRWTEANFGLPEMSFYVGAAPLFFVNPDRVVGDGLGWRGAVGGQFTHISLTFELGVEQLFFHDLKVTGVRFTLGFGI